ncbi:MAG: START domain-containing protein [Chlorobiaceae bacterium]|nr:START domain-containing protein [Chlorobiaceae bacterium]NTW74975.1 START domain-containing protein [Chlorobiaceae bacterium]
MDVATALEGNWDFRVEHKGIRVFSSKVPGSPVLGFKGEAEFKVPFRKLVSLFHDFRSYGRWVHQLAEMEVLDHNDELEYVIRQVINTPWPMPKREMIVRTGLHASEAGAVALTMQGVPDYLPPRTDLHRVRETRGVWVFMPLEGGKVHVTFVMHMNPGSDVPPALSNAALFEVPYYSLQKMRILAEDASYKPDWPKVVDNHLHISEDIPGTP